MREPGNFLNCSSSRSQSPEYCSDIGAVLHRNDSELIFLIDPDEEGLLVVVEDTSAFGPVSVEATSFQESVTFFEQEVVFDQLLLLLWCHVAE